MDKPRRATDVVFGLLCLMRSKRKSSACCLAGDSSTAGSVWAVFFEPWRRAAVDPARKTSTSAPLIPLPLDRILETAAGRRPSAASREHIMRETINIGRTIARERRRRGVTQEALAAHLSVSKAAVSKWELGEARRRVRWPRLRSSSPPVICRPRAAVSPARDLHRRRALRARSPAQPSDRRGRGRLPDRGRLPR